MVRRLASILVADVEGFSRLMEADEAGALAALNARWSTILAPLAAANGGRVVKYLGDGALVEFASVVDAVGVALDVQREMAAANAALPEAQRIRLRIGVHFGDVIDEGGDLFGEGVNLAARLEPLAEAGSICVSDKVRDEVLGKVDGAFRDLGEHALKNISRPVRVYRLDADGADGTAPAETRLAVPEKPSVAVLPFQNMSGDPEQEYFADGIVEDIITELSRFGWLFVIARNSSFAYKGAGLDVRRIGREVGVRYVLEGSVRRAGSRLRISAQLIEAASGAHLWADRFDGEVGDVFELQDRVTACVVSAIAPKVEQAEMARARRKTTGSLDAYDHYLRGLAGFARFTREANSAALAEFERAIALDADYAPAYGMAARTYSQRRGFGWLTDPAREGAEALRYAREAVDRGPDDAVALASAGHAFLLFGMVEEGDAYLDRALRLSPNLAGTWHLSGIAKALLGEAESAAERGLRGLRLSPHDPHAFAMHGTVALGHMLTGRDAEAFAEAAKAFAARPNSIFAATVAAATAGRMHRAPEAERALAQMREVAPDFRIASLPSLLDFRRREDAEILIAGLRAAGVPE